MAGEEACQSLPECVMEKILAMVPFPQVFKAQTLSKSWLVKFSSQEDDEAIGFQNLLSEASYSWRILCPVFVDEGKAIGYDSTSGNWKALPSLEFLPKKFLRRTNLQIEGPLLYALPLTDGTYTFDEGFCKTSTTPGQAQLYVANILTKTWKEVPPLSNAGFKDVFYQTLIIDEPTKAFKVIRFCRSFSVHIYDSKSKSWRIIEDPVSPVNNYKVESVYLDGLLYMVTGRHPTILQAYNVAEGTCEMFSFRKCSDFEDLTYTTVVKLVARNGNMSIFLKWWRPGWQDFQTYIAVQFDLDTKKVWDESCLHPLPNEIIRSCGPVISGEGIFFGLNQENKVVGYNMDFGDWIHCPAPTFPALEGTSRVYNTRGRAKALKLGVQSGGIQKKKKMSNWTASCFDPSLVPFLAV